MYSNNKIKAIRQIVDNNGTPFYFFERKKFVNNITRFRKSLIEKGLNVIIGYSFKTNYTPAICKVAKELDCYAEVVSDVELELARRLDFEKGKVIFNGPKKDLKDIVKAIEMGAIINFDHIEQIEAIEDLDCELKNKVRAGLRVNIDLSDELKSKKIAKGGLVPRFGMGDHQLSKCISLLNKLKIGIISLHGHCSSSDRAPENYNSIVKYLLNVRSKYNLNSIKYIDVGGGFSGNVPSIWNAINSPSFDDYADAISNGLFSDSWFKSNKPKIIIEPGMSVVGDTISIVTSTISRKSVEENIIYGCDANFYHVRPTFHSKPLTYVHLPKDQNESGKIVEKVRAIVGATCMERDLLLEDVELTSPKIGDLIVIEDVGAYCGVLTPNFINTQPAVFEIDESFNTKEIKRKQAFEDFFQCYQF